jgi:hypothetical protein
MIVSTEERVAVELCEKTTRIENQKLAEFQNEGRIAKFSFKLAEQKLRTLNFFIAPYCEASTCQRVKSLKRCALEAVAAEMRDDFEEIKNIAAKFS